MEILLCGDTTLAGVARNLQKKLSASHTVIEAPFGQWLQTAIDFLNSATIESQPNMLLILWSPRILQDPLFNQHFTIFSENLKKNSENKTIFLSLFAVDSRIPRPLTHSIELQQHAAQLNAQLLQWRTQYSWLHLIDQASLFSRYGAERLMNYRTEALGRMVYSPEGASLFSTLIARSLIAHAGKPSAKVLVLDLDNTLWGGILGEEGASGIHLGDTGVGYAYSRFQQACLDLQKSGVLLALASKNNESDALTVLRSHEAMVLKEEHFSAMRINWESKADNLRSIAAQLNVGVESLVFFDDSEFERQQMRELEPRIQVIDVPQDPCDYIKALSDFSGFDQLNVTQEDRKRAKQYQQESGREALKKKNLS